MSVEFFKLVHVFGILMLFSGLVGLWGAASAGDVPRPRRAVLSAIHGLGMLFILLSGFAMAGKLGFAEPIPVWLYLKMAVWLLLGGSMVMARRRAAWGPGLIGLWVCLGTAAAYLALYKPV